MERGRGTHRADIDGLRGLAVGAVIVYHYWPALLPGGFLGVTMFFVLSGYLMGQILESGLDKGSFSFRTFYARRAVRITPALVGVLVTTVVAVLVMCVPPAQVADTASSGAAAALGLGNVQLWHQGGSYFADSEGKRVFLHLWSLGVEEQFYALLPLLLFGCPHGGARMAVVAVSLAVASVAAGWATASAPKAAYYLLPFRVPELLGGVLAAMAQARGGLVVMLVRQRRGAVAWGALAALGAMMGWGFDAATPFPSLWAALPVACTVALLLSGAAADGGDVPLALQLMAEPVMVWVGALSYSLYLYHWPLLALARILSPSALSAPQLWLLVGLTVALASVSFYAIEGPLRVPERAAAVLLVRVGVALLLLAMVATSASWTPALALPPAEPALGLRRSLSAGWSTKRTLFANDSQLNPALFADLRGLPPFIMGADNLVTVLDSGLNPPPFALPKSLLGFGRVRPTRVLLWGDSHAAHSYGILQELMGERKFFAAVHSGCNPVGPVNSRPIDATQWITPSCLEFNPFVMRELVPEHDVIVLVARWRRVLNVLAPLGALVDQLVARNKTVVLVGTVARLPLMETAPCLTATPPADPAHPCNARPLCKDLERVAFNVRLTELAASRRNVWYWDPNHLVCPQGRFHLFLPELRSLGIPLFIADGDHLSYASARVLGRMQVLLFGKPAWALS